MAANLGTTICPRCSESFECGVDSGACWCKDTPLDDTTRSDLATFYKGCLCPACLEQLQERPARPSVRSFLKSQLRRQYGKG